MGLVKHIPNTITLLNLVSGVFGIISAARGDMGCAFAFMLAAAVFDVLDGASARGLKAYSAIGKELDSLADLVSFGVLPSLMLFFKMQEIFAGSAFLTYIPLFIVPCAALRLAKFNIDESQAHGFKGLPVPAAAMFIGSAAALLDIFVSGWFARLFANSFLVMPFAVYIPCRLMLSRLPMVSLKSFSKDTDMQGLDRQGGSSGEASGKAAGTRAVLFTVFLIPVIAGIVVLCAFLHEGFFPALVSGICAMFTMYIIVNTVHGTIRWMHLMSGNAPR